MFALAVFRRIYGVFTALRHTQIRRPDLLMYGIAHPNPHARSLRRLVP